MKMKMTNLQGQESNHQGRAEKLSYAKYFGKKQSRNDNEQQPPLGWSKNFDSAVESGTHPPQTDI